MDPKPVESRSRQANYQHRQHAEGMCPRCGQEKLDFNPRAGKPYTKCPSCRRKWNELQKQLMRDRRKAE